MSIEHDHTLNPVTSLEFYPHVDGVLLLAGEGTYLKVFEPKTSRLLYQCQIFEAQTIHGIVVAQEITSENDLQLVIWGGSSLTLLTSQTVKNLLAGKVDDINITELAVSTPDWILDVIISPSDRSCILITAHNAVLQATLGQRNSVTLNLLSSPSRSILYSAHLIWEQPSGLVLVAAGTVFGEIIVWRCNVDADPLLPEGYKVLCTLTGHEGSIFGVNISPIIDKDGKKTRLLASCSDDRTIRVWDVFDLSLVHAESSEDQDKMRFKSSLARETGFGDNTEWSTNRHLAMAMGHASRIWGVRFYQTVGSTVNLLSVGEDSTAQCWNLESWKKLTHVETYAFHSGKHIFSVAVHNQPGLGASLATGGADGKISYYELPSVGIVTENNSEIEPGLCDEKGPGAELGRKQKEDKEEEKERDDESKWDLESILESLHSTLDESVLVLKPPSSGEPQEDDLQQEDILHEAIAISNFNGAKGKAAKKSKVRKIARDAFNRYAFVSEADLLVTTTFGRVLLGHIDNSIRWRELHLDPSESVTLKSYSIVKGVPSLGLCFLAGANGVVYMYRAGQESAKIGAASELVEIGNVAGKVADLFSLFSPDNRSLSLLVTTLGGENATIICLESISADGYQAGLGSRTVKLPERFVVTSAGTIMEDLLVLCSRSGSIAVYSEANECLGVWPSVHQDAITAVISLPGSATSPTDSKNFLTTSRDGSFSIFAVSCEWSDSRISHISVTSIHNSSPPFGPMIEAAWYDGIDLFLYGFRSKNFIVWNETKQCEIMSVDCGGAHRSYAYSPLKTRAGGGHFAYNKASKLHLHSQKSPSHKIVKEGGHGREIKTCAVSLDKTLIATGAEDTTIRIWNYHNGEMSVEKHFKCLAVVKKHTAGIQHLQWHSAEYLFSSGGNEELFVWAVTTIPGFGVGVVCEASCPDQSEDRDLRIMNFDVTELSEASLAKTAERTLLVSLAYSDSTFRTYAYSKTQGFSHLAQGRYTSSCLTQIRHLYTSQEGTIVLTAATDGKVALWKASPRPDDNAPREYALLSIQKLHQNAIKCLDIEFLADQRSHIVVTGGDDNALGITMYNLGDLSKLISSRLLLKSAHTAAITGLCIISGKETRIWTTGNDQRVREWKLTTHSERRAVAEIEKAGNVFTSIADVGGMAALKDGKILVVGNGMEVWSVGGAQSLVS